MLKDLFFTLKDGNGWIKCSKNVEMWKYGLWKSKLTIHPRARVPIIYIALFAHLHFVRQSTPERGFYAKIPHYVAYTPLYAHSCITYYLLPIT